MMPNSSASGRPARWNCRPHQVAHVLVVLVAADQRRRACRSASGGCRPARRGCTAPSCRSDGRRPAVARRARPPARRRRSRRWRGRRPRRRRRHRRPTTAASASALRFSRRLYAASIVGTEQPFCLHAGGDRRPPCPPARRRSPPCPTGSALPICTSASRYRCSAAAMRWFSASTAAWSRRERPHARAKRQRGQRQRGGEAECGDARQRQNADMRKDTS